MRVALSGEERQPAGALLHRFSWRFVSQQVGNPHAVVAQTLAQGHVAWDGHTARGSLVFPESAGHGTDATAEQEQK